jgi:hypothetical protein
VGSLGKDKPREIKVGRERCRVECTQDGEPTDWVQRRDMKQKGGGKEKLLAWVAIYFMQWNGSG